MRRAQWCSKTYSQSYKSRGFAPGRCGMQTQRSCARRALLAPVRRTILTLSRGDWNRRRRSKPTDPQASAGRLSLGENEEEAAGLAELEEEEQEDDVGFASTPISKGWSVIEAQVRNPQSSRFQASRNTR